MLGNHCIQDDCPFVCVCVCGCVCVCVCVRVVVADVGVGGGWWVWGRVGDGGGEQPAIGLIPTQKYSNIFVTMDMLVTKLRSFRWFETYWRPRDVTVKDKN